MSDHANSSSSEAPDYPAWSRATQREYDRLSGFYDLMSNHYEKKSRERG